MGIVSKVLALCLLAAIPLFLASCGATLPPAGATLPPEGVLHSKIAEVGRAMRMPLVFEDKKEGLFIWSFDLVVCDGRFAWYVKRDGNVLRIDDPTIGKCADNPAMRELFKKETRRIQEEFKRRFLALAGPISIGAPTHLTHSPEILMRAMRKDLDLTSPK